MKFLLTFFPLPLNGSILWVYASRVVSNGEKTHASVRGRFIHFLRSEMVQGWRRCFLKAGRRKKVVSMTLILDEAFSGLSRWCWPSTMMMKLPISSALSHITFVRVTLSRFHLNFLCKESRFPISTSFFLFFVSRLLCSVSFACLSHSHSVSPFRICFISQLTFVIAWEMCGGDNDEQFTSERKSNAHNSQLEQGQLNSTSLGLYEWV